MPGAGNNRRSNTMSKTIRTKVYQFNELSEDAKQKAIQSFEDINVFSDWWDSVYTDFEELCKTIGIDVDLKKTYFNGFYSQGSGSAFTADINVKECLQGIKAEKWKEYAPLENLKFYDVTKNLLRIAPYCWANIRTSNRETSVKCETDMQTCGGDSNVAAEFENLEDFLQDVADTLNHWLYTSLEKEYEYLTSEKAIAETIQANEYFFTKDGKQFNY
jgi:hypothetical protein